MRRIALWSMASGNITKPGNRLIEIGAVELNSHSPTGHTFHTYLNPEIDVDLAITSTTGLTSEFLNDKPKFSQIKGDLLAFIKDAELIVYDAPQVLSVLDKEFEAAGERRIAYHVDAVIDLLILAMERFPNADNSFESLCRRHFVNLSQRGSVGALLNAQILLDLYCAFTSESLNKFFVSKNDEEIYIAKSFSDFIDLTEGISRTALCRGVPNKDYLLVPSLFRKSDMRDPDIMEHNLMWVFKTHARAFLSDIPTTELGWLTVAQHHGLPTRLLDWSLSPLVACFFAAQSLSREDGAVYIYDIGKFKKEEDINVRTLDQIVAFFPSHATKRITAQSGMFTIHPTQNMTLNLKEIKKVIIPAQSKPVFLERLIKFGTHHGNLFPDLDGLANYIRYLNKY